MEISLQSWLNLASSLITKERPYVFRSSLGAISTPQDWHEMVSASAGLSCMTSHGVGICWCHSFSVLKSPSYCSGLAERTSKRILVCPKDAAKFEDVVASNNPAAKTCWVNGVSQDCTCSLGRMARPRSQNQRGKLLCGVMAGSPHGDCLLLNGINYRLLHCHRVFQCKAWQVL